MPTVRKEVREESVEVYRFSDRWEEYSLMTDEQKRRIAILREQGIGYSKIAQVLSMSENTVKTYCRRNGLAGNRSEKKRDDIVFCKCCGIPVEQTSGRKKKMFCSDHCRNKWWNSHLDQVNRKAVYEYTCAYCKKPFMAYGNSKRKYCCHKCFVEDRFGGGRRE